MSRLRRKVAGSPLALVAATPVRLAAVARHNWRVFGRSVRWIFSSREHTNFTYDLDPLNLQHLAWFVATAAAIDVSVARRFIDEARFDTGLADHVRHQTAQNRLRYLADREVRLGRRLGWYAIVRATQPDLVVETGTDKGLGSCVLAAAILRNGKGRMITIDVDPGSGYLLGPPYSDVVDRIVGNSLDVLSAQTEPISIFVHDSLHTREHEVAEYLAIEDRLTDDAFVLSDNAHATNALVTWAERTGRRFAFFAERPLDHWYPGAGIGLAFQRSSLDRTD